MHFLFTWLASPRTLLLTSLPQPVLLSVTSPVPVMISYCRCMSSCITSQVLFTLADSLIGWMLARVAVGVWGEGRLAL